MTLGHIIAEYCDANGMSYRQFARACGLTNGYISMLVNGANPRTGKPLRPGMDTYVKLATGMHMSLDKLFSIMDDSPISLAPIPFPAGLTPKSETPMRRVPVLGDIAAGQPIVALREYDEFVEVPDHGERYDAMLRVKGDSMEPHYLDGDLVMIRYQDDVDDGQIAAVCLDDGVTLKRLYHLKRGLQLVSENPKYPPMVFTDEDVNCTHLVGLAVGYLRWEE